jgi:hypothetical protein
MAVDDRDVYFIGRNPNAIYAVAKTGGDPRLVRNVGTNNDDFWYWEFVVDDRLIYLMNPGMVGSTAPRGGVFYIDKATGQEYFVEAKQSSCALPVLTRLTVFDGDVYYHEISAPPFGCGVHTANTWRIGRGTTTPSLIAPNASAYDIYVDASHLFYTNHDGVWRVSRFGGTPESLAAITDGMRLASSGDWLYVQRNYRVTAITAPGVMHDVAQGTAIQLTADAGALYLANVDAVVRVRPDGTTRTIATGAPHVIAIDDRYVYYDNAAGGIDKACK